VRHSLRHTSPSSYVTPEQVEASLNKRDLDINKSQHDFDQEVNKGVAMDRQQFAVQLERINTRASDDRLKTEQAAAADRLKSEQAAAADRLETKLAIEKSNNKVNIMFVVSIVTMLGLYCLVLLCADPKSPLGKVAPAVISRISRGG
jgi:hypothetical protein